MGGYSCHHQVSNIEASYPSHEKGQFYNSKSNRHLRATQVVFGRKLPLWNFLFHFQDLFPAFFHQICCIEFTFLPTLWRQQKLSREEFLRQQIWEPRIKWGLTLFSRIGMWGQKQQVREELNGKDCEKADEWRGESRKLRAPTWDVWGHILLCGAGKQVSLDEPMLCFPFSLYSFPFYFMVLGLITWTFYKRTI